MIMIVNDNIISLTGTLNFLFKFFLFPLISVEIILISNLVTSNDPQKVNINAIVSKILIKLKFPLS